MYSLLVSAHQEAWEHSEYEFEYSRLWEHTNDEVKARFDADIIGGLLRIPAIFAYEEWIDKPARVGWFDSVRFNGSSISIKFIFDPAVSPINKIVLYKLSPALGITRFESTRTHWAVKDVDLGRALQEAAIITPQTKELLRSHPKNRLIVAPKMASISQEAIPGSVTGGWPMPHTVPAVPAPISPAPQWIQPSSANVESKAQPLTKVFIVHGRDEALLHQVARFIERLQLQAIILHEQGNEGRTLIDKFKAKADEANFAVVLMTPDDMGALAGDIPRPRARQNVILELGYFLARLGSNKVCALHKGGVETPSDFAGVVYVSADNESWKTALARELRSAGIPIDGSRLIDA